METTQRPRTVRWRILAAAALLAAAPAAIPREAAAQSFSPAATPNPLTLTVGGSGATVTVTTNPGVGFNEVVTYTFLGLPGFIQTGGSQSSLPPAYPPLGFSFSLGGGAVPGTYNGTLRALAGPDMVDVPFQVVVEPPPSFTAAASPNPLTLTVGGPGATVTVTTAPDPGFSAPITYSFAGLPGFVATGGSRVVTAPGYGPVGFPFSLSSGAVPGGYEGTLRGVGDGTTVEIPFRVVVAAAPPPPTPPPTPAPTFETAVSPNPVELTIGGPAAAVTVTTTAEPGFSDPIAYRFRGFPAFLETGGERIATPPLFGPLSFPFSLGSGATAGTYSGVLEVRVRGSVDRQIPLTAVVRPRVPVVERTEPATVVAGARSQVVRLVGRDFEPGATVAADSPAVVVEDVRVLSPRLARVTLSVRPDAPARPLRLLLTNPTGATTPVGGRVTVLPADSLAAPLSVTAVAVVFPRPGSQIARGERIFARGVLTVTGSGPVVGSCLADGLVYDRFTVQAVAGRPVRVACRSPIPQLGLGRHELAFEVTHPQRVGSPPVTIVQTVERASGLRTLLPVERAVPAGRPLVFEWTLVPGAVAYEVEVEPPAPVRPLRRETADTRWQPDPSERGALGTGVVRWRVRALFPGGVRGEPTPWLELELLGEEGSGAPAGGGGAAFARSSGGWTPGAVLAAAPPQAGAAGPVGTGMAPSESFLDGAFNAELSASAPGGDEPLAPEEARLALSGQLASRRSGGSIQTTADLSWSRPLEGVVSTEQESESWLARAEGGSGRATVEAGAGYGAPTFLAETELLTAGLARGGAEGAVGSPGRVRVAYYESFDPELGSVASGTLDADQELRAAAFELGGDERRWVLRALGIEVEQEATAFDPGGEGRSFGLFGRVRFGAALSLVFEGARGELEPGEGSFETMREGDAYRLGVEGGAGGFTYSLDLRHVGEGFVNPANPGLTPAGRSDRDAIELSLGRSFGRSNLQARLQRFEGGDGFGPPAVVDAVQLDYSATFGPALYLAFGGNLTATRAEADPELFLPESDRRDWGLTASATATLGGLQLTPSASMQVQEDGDDPAAEVTTSNLGLSAFADGSGGFSLSASLNGTRVDADPVTAGRTDTLSASLQPTWEIAAASLRLQPLLGYTETTNELLGLDTASEQYLLTVAWNPPWLGSLVALEVTGDWSRTRDAFGFGDDELFERYTAVIVLRGGGEARRPRPPPPDAPPPARDTHRTL